MAFLQRIFWEFKKKEAALMTASELIILVVSIS